MGLHTLAEVEEAGGEDGRTEETKEYGATDELEASILTLFAKLLPDAVQSVLKVTAQGRTHTILKDILKITEDY